MAMEFKDRLDAIWNRISSREFLENKGVANEVRYYVFDYEAYDEQIMRQKIKDLLARNNPETDGFQIVEYDIYKPRPVPFFPLVVIISLNNLFLTLSGKPPA